MTTPTPASSSVPGRHCIKCGTEIGPDESICESCNRAGMVAPSASQYHGTVAVAIILAVVALAIAGSLSLRGVGPYRGEVRGVSPATAGYEIDYAVTNEGSKSGRAKCQLLALDADGRRMRAVVALSGPIDGGATSEQTEAIPGLTEAPTRVEITCS
jgi:predicted nucleic acid-binding Zn ribbon protein